MLRTKEALIPYLLWAAAVAAGLLWHESQMLPGLGRTVITGKMDVGGPYRLIDQDGRPRTTADFRGKYQLLYFGYTFCPDVCPTTLALIAASLDKMGPQQSRIVPIFITIDPERDKPQILKKYLAAFGPRFVGLTGSAQNIAAVEKEYRVYAKKQPLKDGNYGMDHSSVIYLLGPDGRLLSFFDDIASPDDLARALLEKMR
jgi:cytochrome oxidase Cu insertion factor (SCO1/SenC/PrrC family)